MPSLQASQTQKQESVEETEDFKYFCRNVMNKEVEKLLPLEQQLQLKRAAEAELALIEEQSTFVTFRALGDREA